MNLVLPTVGVAALALAAFPFISLCDCGDDRGAVAANQQVSLTTAVAPTGDYIEARNVTVWGGHCHLNSEYDHQGDAALVAWAIDGGAFGGVDLAGVRVVAAVASGANLADGEARSSDLFVDATNDIQRAAAERWARTEHADALGTVAAVHAVPIAFEREGDHYRLAVDDLVQLEGSAIADRSCCTMTECRGYEPLMAEAGAVVGFADTLVFEGTETQVGWQYEGANSVFVTEFGAPQGCGGACACESDELPRP
ncbi:hypothetical protein Pla163_04950 [Planctomycetes bacterium Pla163]|uniref:DUF1326 domain-containing protein n=1 Tax=Rohdeia mirabilis TaxID=2528008 RepID=A0A518CVZ1_9BACT|nr:hypothetical protein Pla163_04950 [Planctomycetes bacterium Pla163]